MPVAEPDRAFRPARAGVKPLDRGVHRDEPSTPRIEHAHGRIGIAFGRRPHDGEFPQYFRSAYLARVGPRAQVYLLPAESASLAVASSLLYNLYMNRFFTFLRLLTIGWQVFAFVVSTAPSMLLGLYQYLEGAPWTFVALAAFGAFAAISTPILAFAIWLHLPAAGSFTPRKLGYYKLPIHKLAWNFDNYLGGYGKERGPFLVTSFQPRFNITRGTGIHPKEAYIQSDRTGIREEVLIECGNPYVPADQIEFMPPGKWYHCQKFFGDAGLSKEEFLAKFDGFDFVFSYDEVSFRRHFSRNEIEEIFDAYWRSNNRSSEPKPRAKYKKNGQ